MSDQEKASLSSRWSKRKQAVKQEEALEITQDDGGLVTDQKAQTELTREQQLEQLNQLTDADMPDLTSLDEDADFSGFMSTGVSDRLRQLALKKLFHGASYNLRDGLDEYDDDYTFFEKLDPNTITADMKHMIEVEAEKERRLLEEQALEQRELELAESVVDDESKTVEDSDELDGLEGNEPEISALDETEEQGRVEEQNDLQTQDADSLASESEPTNETLH